MNELEPVYVDDFEKIRQIIEQARQEAAYKVNETIISLYWNIGKFVSEKAQQDGWGRSTVKQLWTLLFLSILYFQMGTFHCKAIIPVYSL